MNALLWLALGVVAAWGMMLASRVAVRESVALAQALRLPPFAIGVTIVSLGTDAPELVNSLVSCSMGHGDVNLGDSVGSVYTQSTLILGLFPFMAGKALRVVRREIWLLGALTVVCLALAALATRDGVLARTEAAWLVLACALAMSVAVRFGATSLPSESGQDKLRHALAHFAVAAVAFGGVALAASVMVRSISALSGFLDLPEFVVSFFGAALGTSLPELVTEVTALRSRQVDLALGNVLGACLLDASLSVSIGPLFFPVDVDADLALRGISVAVAATALATLLLGLRGLHDRWSGLAMLVAYWLAYFAYA